MNHSSVSVIIPAYRAAHTIGQAVDSVLAQTTRPSEILIIDDGSPDDMAAAVAPYGGPGDPDPKAEWRNGECPESWPRSGNRHHDLFLGCR